MKNPVDTLANLYLHDACLDDIRINFEERRYGLAVSRFNEESGDYETLLLNFMGIDKLKMSEMLVFDFNSAEIADHKQKILENGRYAVEFLLSFGLDKPSVDLSFEFTDFELIIKPPHNRSVR